jgi:hypothetical protein
MKTINEILDSPPSALKGIGPEKDAIFAEYVSLPVSHSSSH